MVSSRLTKRFTIGVDLDNTIVSYDSLLYSTAREKGLITSGIGATKLEVREAVRSLLDGETQWQELQGLVYGPRMNNAMLMDGVTEFFQTCKQLEIPAYIVSHKTEYAPYDQSKTNLRTAALTWMSSHGLIEHGVTGLSKETVYFESSRYQKIMRIAELGCTHFIDDLEETFLEDSFPQQVEKILFSPIKQELPLSLDGVTVYNSWQEIKDYFFGVNR